MTYILVWKAEKSNLSIEQKNIECHFVKKVSISRHFFKAGADAIKKFTPSLGIPNLGI